jgi:hypothetical protein
VFGEYEDYGVRSYYVEKNEGESSFLAIALKFAKEDDGNGFF